MVKGKMMLKRYRMVVLALLLALVVLPAAAAERVDTLPPIKSYNSARFEQLLTINTMPLIVGRGEMESSDRMYFVLRTLPFVGMDESTLEIVLYDGTMYTREGGDTQWYIEDTNVPLALSSDDMPPVTKIGTVNVAGTPTDQYQIWIQDDPMGDLLKLDLWIGQAQNYIYQAQLLIMTNDPDLGELTLTSLERFYDFDAAIKVGPPANAKVRPNPTTLASFSRQNRGLNTLAAPFASSTVRDLVSARLSR